MEIAEKEAKQTVLKGIGKFMKTLQANKLKPKKVPEPEKKEDDLTPEELEKLKEFYASKKENTKE